MQIALCTYHRHDDEVVLTDILQGNGFKTSFSKKAT